MKIEEWERQIIRGIREQRGSSDKEKDDGGSEDGRDVVDSDDRQGEDSEKIGRTLQEISF